jgi:hypothetical protein
MLYLHDDALPGVRKGTAPVASIVGRWVVFYAAMVGIINRQTPSTAGTTS